MLATTLYPPGVLHRIPASAKLLFLAASGVALYSLDAIPWPAGFCLVTLGLYSASGRQAWRSLRAFRGLALLIVALFLWQWWSFDLATSTQLVLRMSGLILLANLVTITTRLDDMLAAATPVFRPLSIFGLSPDRLAFAVILVVRFVPALMQTAESLDATWRSRGGGRNRWRLLVPLFIATLKLSDQVADAVAARGGLSGAPSTQARRPKND